MAAKDDYLIEQLVDLGYVTNEQLEPLRAEAAASGAGIIDLLLERKLVSQVDVATAKAAHFGAEFVKLSDLRLEDEVISAVPRHIAKRYRVVPIFRHGNNADPQQADNLLTAALHDAHANIVISDIDADKPISQDIQPLWERCRDCPFTRSSIWRSCASGISSGVTIHGPSGQNVSIALHIENTPERISRR